MYILDANILIYAYNPSSSESAKCAAWLIDKFNNSPAVGIPWVTINAFIRITTNHRAFLNPLSTKEAVDIISEILSLPSVMTPKENQDFWEIYSNQLKTNQVSGPLISDTYLAALSILHGATLVSTDKDFLRFSEIKLENPLET